MYLWSSVLNCNFLWLYYFFDMIIVVVLDSTKILTLAHASLRSWIQAEGRSHMCAACGLKRVDGRSNNKLHRGYYISIIWESDVVEMVKHNIIFDRLFGKLCQSQVKRIQYSCRVNTVGITVDLENGRL